MCLLDGFPAALRSAIAPPTGGAAGGHDRARQRGQAAGFLLPIDLGARGSCRIGGNIATDAGGRWVVRDGMTRDSLLGLDVALAVGTVLENLGPGRVTRAAGPPCLAWDGDLKPARHRHGAAIISPRPPCSRGVGSGA